MINESVVSKISSMESNFVIAYFHAQRTGGSEFKRFLKRAFGARHVMSQQTTDKYKPWGKITNTDLMNYFVYAGHTNYKKKKLAKCILPVSLTRDPVIRTHSIYNYCKTKVGHPLRELALEKCIEEFYQTAIAVKPEYFVNTQCIRICGEGSFVKAKSIIEADYLGVATIDGLHEFSKQICEIFGINAALPEKREPDLSLYPNIKAEKFDYLVAEMNREDTKLHQWVSSFYG